MSTRKNEETIPVNPKGGLEKTKPSAAVNEAPVDSPVAASQLRKSARKARAVAETVAQAPNPEESGEEKPAKKIRRGPWIWLGILIMLVITAAGCFIGYASAIRARQAEELNNRLTAATTQYVLSLQDIQNNDLEMARRRLEYVIQVYPDYPDASTKLTQVLVALAQNNPSATQAPVVAATVEPTVDTSNLDALYAQAQQQLASKDWDNLLASVNGLRNTDPTYQSVKVDGLYYIALRNMGIKKISQGYHEIGIYYLTLASKIGPLDTDAQSYESWAKMYLNAAAAWEVNWPRVTDGFATLYSMVPSMIDFNGVSVTKRYAQALAGYGDFLQSTYDWCGAKDKYEQSLGIVQLPSVLAIIEDARNKCANPPPTPTPTLLPGQTPTP